MATDINLTPTAGMPPVTTETAGTSSTRGGSQVMQSPAAQASQAAQGQALDNIASAEQSVQDTLPAQLEAKAAASDLMAANAATGIDEAQELIKKRQPIIDEAKRQAQQAESNYANHQFHDFFSSKPVGDRIMLRVAMGLNSLGNGILGVAGNQVADRMQQDAELDYKRQERDLYSKEKQAEWKRKGVTDMYAQLQDELAALKTKQALAHENTAAKAEAMLTRAGIPKEVAAQSVIVAKQREAAAQFRTEADQRYERKAENSQVKNSSTQTTSAKGATGGGVEADKNAANYDVLKTHSARIADQLPKLAPNDVAAVNRVMNSEDFLDGKPILTSIAGIFGKDAESGISDSAKAYLQDVRSAAEAFGRVQSGGAIGGIENKRFVRSFMPMQSDSVKARETRAKNILSDTEARGKFLARPPKNVGEAGSNPPKPQIPPGAIVGRRKSDNKRGYKLDGKFVPLE